MMIIKARDLLHEVLEGGDLDYQIYVVNEERDREYQIRSMKVYDDVIDINIITPYDETQRENTINNLEIIKHNIINKNMYGVYEITKDLERIIQGLK